MNNQKVREENSVDILKGDTVNSKSQDSFNKDLVKRYKEHKKSETKVPHWAISSYTANRNFNKANKEEPVKQVKNKPQSAQTTKRYNNSKNSNSKDQNKNNENEENNNDIGIEEILKDLNNFL